LGRSILYRLGLSVLLKRLLLQNAKVRGLIVEMITLLAIEILWGGAIHQHRPVNQVKGTRAISKHTVAGIGGAKSLSGVYTGSFGRVGTRRLCPGTRG
jgi:hypothetical protein